MKQKEHLLERIYGEYQSFRASILSLPNGEIFAKCYEIDVMTNFYEILAELIEQLSEATVNTLLEQKNILPELYQRWLRKDDSNYLELENHVKDEIEEMAA